MRFLDSAFDWIQGLPFSEVWPSRPSPQTRPWDGRTCALVVLRKYLSELTFNLPGDYNAKNGTYGPPQPFRLCEENIYIDMPDAMEQAALPSIAIVGGQAKYEPIGLTTYLDEETRDVFGKGSVVQWQSEFTETFTLEVWAANVAQRRALVSGIESSLTPTEYMYGIRFKMPNYYMQTVCFTLASRQDASDSGAALGRRKSSFEVEMRFNVVALVNYSPLTLFVDVTTEEP